MSPQTASVAREPSADKLPHSYDRTTIQLHWMTAGLVALLWGIAQIIDFFPRGQPRTTIRSMHILLGVILAVTLVTRIIWRARSGRRLPLPEPGFIGYSAKIVHYGLYVLLAATVVLGVANVWVRGDSIFGLFSVPRYATSDKILRHTVGDLHGTFANAILIVAGLHALAALTHHYVLHDSMLRRMLPGRSAK